MASQPTEPDTTTALAARRPDEEPDVLLDVPELRVDEISLEVENLHARVSLDANVLQLLRLHVGVDAELGTVKLTIKGVEARVLLKVRLDNVARIVERVLKTIDDHPEIVEQLVTQLGETAGGVTGAAGQIARGAGEVVGGTAAGATSAVRPPAPGQPKPPERP